MEKGWIVVLFGDRSPGGQKSGEVRRTGLRRKCHLGADVQQAGAHKGPSLGKKLELEIRIWGPTE